MPVRSLTTDEVQGWVLQEEDWATFVNNTTGLLHTALTGFSLRAGFCAALRGKKPSA
jgi:hypothetical protein